MGKTLSNSVEGFDEGSQWHYEMHEVCLVNHSQFDKLFSPQNFTAIALYTVQKHTNCRSQYSGSMQATSNSI